MSTHFRKVEMRVDFDIEEQLSRTTMLIGQEGVMKLQKSHVAVFGLGGVGGSVVEGLVRAGIGEFTIVDNDIICLSNLNRQIIATHETIGRKKVQAMANRMKAINPQVKIHMMECFFLPETSSDFDFSQYNYVVDAIDTVTGKLEIIEQAKKSQTPVISCMGTGNKLHPELFQIADISKTSVCPLAKVMRRELKKREIDHIKVLYSKEEPIVPDKATIQESTSRRGLPGSISFAPPIAGLLIAGEVIRDILKEN